MLGVMDQHENVSIPKDTQFHLVNHNIYNEHISKNTRNIVMVKNGVLTGTLYWTQFRANTLFENSDNEQ